MRLGIVGNGESATSFAGAAHFVEGVELIAIAGRSRAKVAPLCAKFGGEALTIDELAAARLDCVAISTPPGLRCEHALPFLERGVHAMIEKPLALSVAECDRLIDAADASAARLMVTQTHRYAAYGRKARAIVDSGRFGKVLSTSAFLGFDYFSAKRSGWQLDPALSGGGVTFNPFIHLIDFARYLAAPPGDVAEVTGCVGFHKPGYTIDSDVQCLARLADGSSALVQVDGCGHRPGHLVDVIMEQGAMAIRPLDKRIEILIKGRVAEVFGFGENGQTNDRGIYGHGGYIGHIEEMQRVIQQGGTLTSDGPSGRANVAIARQLLDASR